MSEKITKIEVLSIPLYKHRYIYDQVEKRETPDESRQGSQLLVSAYREMEERERERAQLLQKRDPESLPAKPQEEPPQRFKRLSKPKFSIYDYSEIEHDQMEENVAALINQDGYYDELIPIDEDVYTDAPVEGLKKKILLITLSVIATLVFLYFIFFRS